MLDIGLAEELAQDALVAALEQWPESGVPDNPGARLLATAKRCTIDVLRRGEALQRKDEARAAAMAVAQQVARTDPDAPAVKAYRSCRRCSAPPAAG